MLRFLIRRLLWMVPVLLTVALVTFVLMRLAPGGPWDREKPLPPEIVENLNRRYHLDEPAWKQFLLYVWNASHGDLGPSYQYKDRSVTDILLGGLSVTARLGIQAVILAVLIGVPLGIVAALRQNSWMDYASLFFATIGTSVPSFVLGIFFIVIFSVTLRLLPVAAIDWSRWEPWVMPTVVLAMAPAAFLARLTRASVLETIRFDYVRTARAKGLPEKVVILKHVLKNSLIPVTTVLGPATATLITGSFIVETVFSVPGIGRLYIQSIGQRDYSMIMGTTLFYATMIALANLLVDVGYGALDPRIRLGE